MSGFVFDNVGKKWKRGNPQIRKQTTAWPLACGAHTRSAVVSPRQVGPDIFRNLIRRMWHVNMFPQPIASTLAVTRDDHHDRLPFPSCLSPF